MNTVRGFTLIELIVVLGITAALGVALVTSLSGLKSKDSLDRALQQVYDDLILIRSRAISTNEPHRITFMTRTQWKVESFDGTNWVDTGEMKNFPSNIFLTEDTYENAVDTSVTPITGNLEATPRGIFVFQNASIGSPFVTVESVGSSVTRSIIVGVGGALDKQLN